MFKGFLGVGFNKISIFYLVFFELFNKTLINVSFSSFVGSRLFGFDFEREFINGNCGIWSSNFFSFNETFINV